MRATSLLPLAVLGLPILEIAVFIMVGDEIGVLPTLALVVLSAVIGIGLMQRQGLTLLTRIQAELDAGRMPAETLFHGALMVAAGLLLVIPGFVTDLAGIALFLPPVRRAIWNALRRRVEVTVVEARAPRGPGVTRPVVDLDPDAYRRSDDTGPTHGASPDGTPWRLPPR